VRFSISSLVKRVASHRLSSVQNSPEDASPVVEEGTISGRPLEAGFGWFVEQELSRCLRRMEKPCRSNAAFTDAKGAPLQQAIESHSLIDFCFADP
jgi:hypothetical protein